MASSSQAVYQELIELVLDQESAIKSIQGVALNLKNAMTEAGQLTQAQLTRAFEAVREAALAVSADIRAEFKNEMEERIRWTREATDVIAEQESKLNATLADEHRTLLEKEAAQSEQAAKEAQAIASASMKTVMAEEKSAGLTLQAMQKELIAYRIGAQKEAAALENAEFARRVEHNNILLAAEKEIEVKHKSAFQQRIEQLREEDALIKKRNEDDQNDSGPKSRPGAVGVNQRGSLTGGILRVGAGVAGATGDFQLAAGLYAVERSIGVIQTQLPLVVETLGVTTVAVGTFFAAFAAGGVGLAFMGREFNAELAKISPLLLQAGQSAETFRESLHKVAEEAVDISVRFDRSLKDVVEGFGEALRSGITPEQLVPFTTAVGTLANALGLPLKQATDLLTAFKTEYELTIPELSHVNDILFNMSSMGHVNVEELHRSFGRLVPVAKAAGLSLEDIAAGVTTLVRGGMASAQAVASMSTIIEKTVNPTKTAAAAFKALGIEFGESTFAGKSFVSFIDELREKTGGDLDVIGKLFKDRSAKRGIASLIELNGLLEETTSKIGTVGTASAASNAVMDTFGTHMSQIWTAVVDELKFAGNEILNAWNAIFNTGMSTKDFLANTRLIVAEVVQVFVDAAVLIAGVLKATMDVVTLHFSAAHDSLKAMWSQFSTVNSDFAAHLQNIKDGVSEVVAISGEPQLWSGWKKADDVLEELNGKVAKYSESIAELNEKDIKNRLTKDQTQELKELDEQAITVQRHIAEAGARVVAANKSIIDDARAAVKAFADANGAGQNMTVGDQNAWLRSLNRDQQDTWGELNNRLASALTAKITIKPPDDLEEQAKKIEDRIQEIKDKALTQQLPKERSDDFTSKLQHQIDNIPLDDIDARIKKIEKLLDEISEYGMTQPLSKVQSALKSDLSKQLSELTTIQKDYYSMATKDAEEYYNKDWALYKETVDKKKKEIEKLEKILKGEQDGLAKFSASLNDVLNKAAARRFSGNPDAQVRFYGSQFNDKAQSIREHISNGDFRTEKSFLDAVEELKKVMEEQASADKDPTRSSRKEADEGEIIQKLVSDFDTAFKSMIASNIGDINNRKNSVRPVTPEEAAKKGAEIAKKEITIKEQKIVNDLSIKVDGLATEELVKKIADTVILTLEKNLKNETNPKQYDNSTWSNGDNNQ